MPRWWWVLSFVLLAACGPSPAAPNAPRLRDLAVLEDPDGTLRAEDVMELALRAPTRFRPLPESLAAGFTRRVHWVRFTVEVPGQAAWLDILPPYLDDVRLYEADERTGLRERRAGDLLPFAARETPYRGFAFALGPTPPEGRTTLLRLQTVGTSILVPRVWSDDQFHQVVARESGVLLGLIAVLVSVLALNVITWLWLRERIHLLFAGHLAAQAFLFVGNGGFAAQFLLPDAPAVTDTWVAVAALLAIALVAPVYRELLLVDGQPRWLVWLTRVQFWGALVGIVPRSLGWHPETLRIANAVLLMTIVLGIGLALRPERRRRDGGWFLAAAVLVTLAGGFASTMQILGATAGHFLQLHSLNIAAVGAVLAMHIAIGARYRGLRDQQIRAAEDASRERLIREQHEEFIDLVTHEYRTPLSVLQTHVDILDLEPPAEQRGRSRAAMHTAIARLRAIFDGPLRNRGWSAGLAGLRLESLDVVPLVDGAAAQARQGAAAAGCSVIVDPRPASALVHADARLMTTAICNLIDNAAKYARPGTTIGVAVTVLAAETRIIVRNDCAADPGASLDALMGKYTRGDNTANTSGLGMGLFLVRRIMDDQGGRLVLARDGDAFTATLVIHSAAEPAS